jgi:predicted aldo/keto reductase-like oxidoreductase
MYKEEDKALEALNHALDLGITYVDTAFSYGNGRSEERVGKVMKTRRKGVWLATKIQDRNGDAAMRIFEGSLKRLQTDHVDLVHIHGLGDEDDLKAVEAPDGVLKVFYKLRDQKMARFIGVTCHSNPGVLKQALERHDFDCTQMALNAAQVGQDRKVKTGPDFSFQSVALPVALRKKMGVTAMKIFAQERLSGAAPVDQLIRYSMSLPVAAAVIGMPKLEYLEENVRIAKAFKPLPKSEMQDLSRRLSAAHKASLDRFFSDHIDA